MEEAEVEDVVEEDLEEDEVDLVGEVGLAVEDTDEETKLNILFQVISAAW